MHTATYSPEDNKLRLYPGERLDTDKDWYLNEFKPAGFKWAAKQECFVCARWTTTAEDMLLTLVDEIGDEDYSPEERSADRAERFGGYRDKRRGEAGGHADTFEAGPSVFGHQNRQRAERQAARHDRHRGRALSQWSKAEYWQERTAGVIAHALHKSCARVRRGRILRLESELRRYGHMSERWKAHYELRLTYERAMLQNEGGSAAAVDIEPGGFVGSYQVQKVNKSPATGRVVSVMVYADAQHYRGEGVMRADGTFGKPLTLQKLNIERFGENVYRPPTDEERATFKEKQAADKKAKAAKAKANPSPKLINPTPEDAERLQAIWNAEAKARHDAGKRGGRFEPSAVATMTQAAYSQRSRGDYGNCETCTITEKLKTYHRHSIGDPGGRVQVFKVRKAHATGSSFLSPDRVVVLTDKPQKPIPWDVVEEARAAQPQESDVFPHLRRVVAGLANYQLRQDDKEVAQLIEDAQYVGWAYCRSTSQGELTEAGNDAYQRLLTDEQEAVTA